jgi:hypothetical protein
VGAEVMLVRAADLDAYGRIDLAETSFATTAVDVLLNGGRRLTYAAGSGRDA